MNTAADTRRRLLDSARDLIYSRSYSDVGVQAICGHAGVRKGSFYHFFPSKRELTLVVLDEFLTDFERDLFGRAFALQRPPMDRFDALIELFYQLQKGIARITGQVLGCPFGNLAAEMSTQDEPIRQRLEGIFGSLEGYFEDTLTEAVSTGAIDAVDTLATARAMLAYLEGILLLAKTHNDPELIRRLGPALADLRIRRG